ncbi:MAG: hypothetical protein HYU36_19735 [Planctomycetes bacterium]|nr:hypothetical protein [Planctomycetota bacterium]
MSQSKTFDRPFPAPSPAQRCYLDVYGCVVVENVFSPEEVLILRDALQRLKRGLLTTLFLGRGHWTRGPKYRTLQDAADERRFHLCDGWSG